MSRQHMMAHLCTAKHQTTSEQDAQVSTYVHQCGSHFTAALSLRSHRVGVNQTEEIFALDLARSSLAFLSLGRPVIDLAKLPF